MEDNQDYSFNINVDNPEFAVMTLNRQVLGGNDGILFSSRLTEISDMKVKHLVIDMKNVEAMNSSGLGMLVGGLATLRKYYIGVILVAIPEKILKILQVTHLDKVFVIRDSVDKVLEEYN